MTNPSLLENLEQTVSRALSEDIGTGDISAELISAHENAQANILCREEAIICGRPWVEETFRQVNSDIQVQWFVHEGEQCHANQVILQIKGKARDLLTAERCALNFLQTLSATATSAHKYQNLIKHTTTQILDTRKTLPGLRLAQKYAVDIGGCKNHRLGLYDAFLIKENHIAASGSIAKVLAQAKSLYPNRPVEIEVESIEDLQEALAAGSDTIMLDNFSIEMLKEAVTLNAGRSQLEASGGYNEKSVIEVAETGVDYISIGAITKHCQAVDFSMLIN